jgi:superfamily II DNA/RNA helicase
MMIFQDLHIADDLIGILEQEGITEPTPIQRSAIPSVAEGKDVIIRSHTGTGKTLAYLLPIMQRIQPEIRDVQAVVVAPTQELSMQIVRVAEKLGQARGIRTLGLIGGANLKRQIERMKEHPQLVVGTPGRLVELLKLRKLKLHQTRIIVIDEFDQVFQLGEQSSVEELLHGALRDRQLVFVSATLPGSLTEAVNRWMRDPLYIDEAGEERTATSLEHVYFVCEPRERIEFLSKLIKHFKPQAALVFVGHTDTIAEVTEKLKFNGIQAEALYGDQPKLERTVVLDRLRSGKLQVLVATDLAARGLDIPSLSHVISFHPAPDSDYYVHRAGRTGRMGKRGTAATIVTPSELFIIRKFEKQLGITIRRKELYFGRIVDPEKKQVMKATNVRKDASKSLQAGKKEKKRKTDSKNKGAPRWLKEKMKNRPE